MFCFSSPFGRREGGELSEGRSSGIRVEEDDDDALEDVEPDSGGQDAGKSTVVRLQVSGSQKNENPRNIVFNNCSINNSTAAGNGDISSVRPVQRLNLTNWNNGTSLTSGNKKCLREDLLGSCGDTNVASPLGSASSAASSAGEVSEGMGDEEEEEEEEEGVDEEDEGGLRDRNANSKRRRRRRRRRREEEEEAHESLESGCSRGGAGSGTSPSGSSGVVGAEGGGSGSSDSLLSPAYSSAPATSLTPRSGPRFKLLAEGDVQVCVVQHCRGLVGKVLASKFLRRWEMHHLYLNDTCISSKTPTGFMESSVPYCSMEEVHSVGRWDASHRFCLRIIIPTGSILLQANNSYTRDQWYHSIVWKKNMYKHRNILRNSTRPEVILREVKSLVSLATNTPLQDECVAHVPLQIVSSLLAEEHPPWSSYQINSPSDDESFCGEEGFDDEVEEEMVWAIGPLLEDRPPPPELCRFFSRRCLLRPRSSLVPRIFTPVVHRILKHNVDFGKHPHMRRFVQDYIRALHSHNGGCDVVRGFVSSVHGQSSGCPHPRVLPNLVSVCLGAIFSHFEARCRRLQRLKRQRQLRLSRSETEGEGTDASVANAAARKTFKLRMSGRRESLRRGNAAAWGLEDGEGGWRKGRAVDAVGSESEIFSYCDRRGSGVKCDIPLKKLPNGRRDSAKQVEIPAIVCIHNQKEQEGEGEATTTQSVQSMERDGTLVRTNGGGGAPLAQQEEDVDDDEDTASGERERLLGREESGEGTVPTEGSLRTERVEEHIEKDRVLLEGKHEEDDDEVERVWKEKLKRQEEEEESQLRCYITVFLAISEYDDWRPGLAQLLQPIPFPDDALTHEPFLSGLVPVVRRIGTDPRCDVHQMVLGVREGKEGLFSLYCPTSSSASSSSLTHYFSPMPSPTFPFPFPSSPLPMFPPSNFQHHLCTTSSAPVSASPFANSCPSSPYSGPPYSAPPYSRTFHQESSSFDDGSLWCEILGTLLNCCCRRKRFVSMLAARHLGACMLLALRDQPQAQDALCLMLEWNLLGGGGKAVGWGGTANKGGGEENKEEDLAVRNKGERVVRRKRTVRRRIRLSDRSVPGMNLDDGRLEPDDILLAGFQKSIECKNSVDMITAASSNENAVVATIPRLESDSTKFRENERNIHHDASSSDINYDSVVVRPKLDFSCNRECSASVEGEGNKSEIVGNEFEERDKFSKDISKASLASKSTLNDNVEILDPVKSKVTLSPISPPSMRGDAAISSQYQQTKRGLGASSELGSKKQSVANSKLCDEDGGDGDNGRLAKDLVKSSEAKLGSLKPLDDDEVIVEVDNEEDDEVEEEDEDEDDDEEEDQRTLQVATTLQSTDSGRAKYAALCQRQMHLRQLQQQGGPRKLSLPPRSTDADMCRLVLGGGRSSEEGEDREGDKDKVLNDVSHPLARLPPYARFGSLECLSLAFTHVTSACAAHLIHIPSLRYLNLWSTQFGDAGLQLICEHLHRLQVLNLCETPVTDKGILCLTALKNLHRLNLNSTRLSPETFEKLKASLPALQECDVRYTDAW